MLGRLSVPYNADEIALPKNKIKKEDKSHCKNECTIKIKKYDKKEILSKQPNTNLIDIKG